MPRMSMAWRCFSQAPDYSCTELFLRQNKKGAITRYISTPYTPEGRLKVESVAPAAGAKIEPQKPRVVAAVGRPKSRWRWRCADWFDARAPARESRRLAFVGPRTASEAHNLEARRSARDQAEAASAWAAEWRHGRRLAQAWCRLLRSRNICGGHGGSRR